MPRVHGIASVFLYAQVKKVTLCYNQVINMVMLIKVPERLRLKLDNGREVTPNSSYIFCL